MIAIDFEVLPSTLSRYAGHVLSRENAAALEETFFLAPVCFVIDGTSLLRVADRDYDELPLLGFASHLYTALTSLGDDSRKTVYLAGGGELELHRYGALIEVGSTLTHVTVSAPRAELLGAALNFLRSVESLLRDAFPEFASHTMWPTWFPAAPEAGGESDPQSDP